jgi:prepilin-type N-terminal cleavage/methylation domain-containing protein
MIPLSSHANARRTPRNSGGFTLIELLVVISIISVLSSVILVAVGPAREKAKVARAQEDLIQIRNAISVMAVDTNTWPNGCTPGYIFPDVGVGGVANELALNVPASGLTATRPSSVGSGDPNPANDIGDINPADSAGCNGWSSSAAASWHGPYLPAGTALIDPWGNPYWFDNDYEAYLDCPSKTPILNLAVVVSFGPDGPQGAANPFSGDLKPNDGYYCDQIFVPIY